MWGFALLGVWKGICEMRGFVGTFSIAWFEW